MTLILRTVVGLIQVVAVGVLVVYVTLVVSAAMRVWAWKGGRHE